MTTTELYPAAARPIRVWPGALIAAILVIVRFAAPIVLPDAGLIAVLGGVAAGVAILIWWLFFSRAPWLERAGVLVLMVAAVAVTRYVVHPSIRGGMMGMTLPMYLAIPSLPLALVAAVVLTRHAGARTRRAAIVVAILLTCGIFTLLRTEGVKGGTSQITWRWTPTAEERLLATAPAAPVAPATAVVVPPPAAAPVPATAGTPSEKPAGAGRGVAPAAPAAARSDAKAPVATLPVRWPGFRGPGRDSVIHGVRIATDWNQSPPVELWRRPIGPGWSSFAVAGDYLYTQEQRGDDEIVAWRAAAAAMHIPYDEELGVHPQVRDFTLMKEWHFAATRPEDYPLLMHFPYLDLYRHFSYNDRQHQTPAALAFLQLAAILLATLERQLQGELDLLAGETTVVGGLLQWPIEPRRRHLETLVSQALHFQHVLELARHPLAVIDCDGARRRGRLRLVLVDVEAQEPAGASLNVDQLITETLDGRLDGALPTHFREIQPIQYGCLIKAIKQKKWAGELRPFELFWEKRIVTRARGPSKPTAPHQALNDPRARIPRHTHQAETSWAFLPASAS